MALKNKFFGNSKLRLQETVITSTNNLEWPSANADIKLLQDLEKHRIDITGAGAANATVEYRKVSGGAYTTITPPTDWTVPETWLYSGAYQFRITAVSGDITLDIKSYN